MLIIDFKTMRSLTLSNVRSVSSVLYEKNDANNIITFYRHPGFCPGKKSGFNVTNGEWEKIPRL